jgi:hypothetical protein
LNTDIDHLVVVAETLAQGAAWCEATFGVAPGPGGRHPLMGTHKRLLRIDGPAFPRAYLEIIAVDPEAPAPGRPRWFGLDDPALKEKIAERPRLIHWVARCEDIVAASAACPEPPGDILDLARGDFRWRITVPADGHLPGDGLVPSLIQWRSPAHPADNLPERGCALMKLEGFHPEPIAIDKALGALGLAGALAPYPAEPGEAPNLVAYLRVPSGLREID